MKRKLRLLGMIGIGLIATGAMAQPVLGQVDTFEDGTISFWGGAGPINIENGGPNGSGDNYLQFTGNGGFGSQSVPSVFNDSQWGGNYTTPGIKVIRADISNLTTTNVRMRLVLHGSLGSRWTTTTGIDLNQTPWRKIYFILRQDQFTQVLGTESFSDVMNLCFKFQIRNDYGTPSSGGDGAAATLGLDNVSALATLPISPSSLTLVEGFPFGGSVNSVAASDNDYYFILNDETVPNATLTLTETPAFVPNITWGGVRLTVESAATRNDITLFTDLRNFVTNAFENVGAGTTTLNDSNLIATVTTNPNRFVQSGTSKVEARLRWVPFQDLEAADGWSERVDLVRWDLIP